MARVTLSCACAGATASFDTRLRGLDPGCAVIADNDDQCGVMSHIRVNPGVSGTYRVEVTGVNVLNAGTYTLGYHQLCNDPLGSCVSPDGALNTPTTTCQTISDSLSCYNSAAYSVLLDAGRDYTFTLSNFGTMAGRYATPLVTPPTVAILGVGKVQRDVVAAANGPEIHMRLPLSLTFDHRCATGGEACRFLGAVIADLAQAQ